MDDLKNSKNIDSTLRSNGSDLINLRTARDDLLHTLEKSSAQAKPMPLLNIPKQPSSSQIQVIASNVASGNESQQLKYL
jgi:hypothetical protein